MSRHKKFYLTLTLALCLIALTILGSELFAFSHLSIIQSSLSESNYRAGKIDEKVKNLTLLKTRYADVEDSIKDINRALPTEKESSQLLSDLDTLANTSGLKMTLLQSSTSAGSKAKKISDPALLQTVKGKYGYELPLEIKVEGPYQNFVAFMKSLESYQRMIRVSTVEITRAEDKESSPDNINVKLIITAYLQK